MEYKKTHCEYCGKILDSSFYFCINCGKPYKDSEQTSLQNVPHNTKYSIKIDTIKSTFNFYWILFGIYFSLIILRILTGSELNDLGFSVISYFFLLIYAVVIIYFGKISIKAYFSWNKVHIRILFISLAVLALLIIINFAYHGFLRQIFDSISEEVNAYPNIYSSFAVDFLFICVLPAFIEEIFFRGIIQTNFESVIKGKNAILISSALFAITHFNILSFPYLFLLGYMLGFIKNRYNTLWIPIIIHLVHNLIVIVFTYI